MSLTPTQVEFNDFSGGITDEYLPGPQNRYQRCDNLFITRNRKLEQRPGSDLLDSDNPQIPAGRQRIGALINFDHNDTLLYQSKTSLYYVDTAWVELMGPTGNPALAPNSDTNHIAYSHWNHQLFVVSDSGASPIKIYRDENGVLQVRTAGLPDLADTPNWVDNTAIAAAILLANDLRTKMLLHFASAGLHLLADAASAALITAPASSDLSTLLTLTRQLLLAYSAHYKDSIRSRAVYHDGVNSNVMGGVNPVIYAPSHALSSTVAPTTIEACTDRLNDLRVKYMEHNGDIDVHPGFYSGGVYQSTAPQLAVNLLTPLTTGPTFSDGLQELYDLANELKAQFNAHIASGGVLYTGTITSGSDTITLVPSTAGVNVGDFIVSNLFAPGTTVLAKTGTTIQGSTTAVSNGANAFIVPPTKAHPAKIVTSGSTPTDIANGMITLADATTQESLAQLVFQLRAQYIRHYTGGPSNWNANEISVTHLGYYLPPNVAIPASHQLADRSSLINYASVSAGAYYDDYGGFPQGELAGIRAALTELLAAFNTHQADQIQHYPNPAITTTYEFFVKGEAPLSGDYLYAFHYEYTYFVGTTEYVDRGPILLKLASQKTDPGNYPQVISNLPVIANAGEGNYDTGRIVIKIARSKKNQTDLRYIGEVTNGTTTFTDDTPDSELSGEQIYTAGGVVDNDPPPVARFLHILDGVAYYGGITDTDGTVLPNRVRQAIDGDPDSVPGDFYVDFDEEITGISSTRERAVVFCTDSIYRIEGTFDLRGQGGISKIRISETIGCVSHGSIVQTDLGLFFAGNEGFCWTDGYQVQQITDWNRTYALLVATNAQCKRIKGCYDKYTGRIWWATQYRQDSTDNDSAYVLHLHPWVSVSGAMPFTSASGTSFSPTSFVVFDKQFLRADKRGYTFVHDDTFSNDPVIDILIDPSLWQSEAVIYNYTSCGSDFGTSSIKKWVTRVTMRCKNSSNVSMQVNSNNDDGRQIDALTPVKFRGQMTWGDPNVQWGDPNLFWNYQGMIEDSRHFPAGSLRAVFKQIQLTNAFVPIENSDSKGLALVNAGAKTATLVDGTIQDWNEDAVGYFIAFEDDGFVQEFLILERTSGDVLIFEDRDNVIATNGNRKWVVRGYPKSEKFSLLNYTIHHAYLGTRSTQAFVQTNGEDA
jgi:hypothetical protein